MKMYFPKSGLKYKKTFFFFFFPLIGKFFFITRSRLKNFHSGEFICQKLFTLCLDMQLYTMRACISLRRYFQLNSTKMLMPFFVHKFAFKLANIFKYFTTTLIGINILLIICMERKQT